MEMTLHSKAWKIDTSNFSEPWFAPDEVWYAETRGKAKKEIFEHIRYEGFKDTKFEEITFLTLKVIRAKEADKFLLDGKIKTMSDIKYDLRLKERNDKLDKLLLDNPNGWAYIKKGGYYYMSGYCGYTEFRSRAGVYTLEDAVKEVKRTSLECHMDAILINIEEHNKMIKDSIESLQEKLISV